MPILELLGKARMLALQGNLAAAHERALDPRHDLQTVTVRDDQIAPLPRLDVSHL